MDVGSTGELPDFQFHRSPHQLTFFDVMLLRRGRGRLLQEDRWYPVRPGTVVFHSAGEHRRWLLGAEAEGLVLFFTEEFLLSFLQDAGFVRALPFFRPDAPRTMALEERERAWMEERLHGMRDEILRPRWGRTPVLQATCFEVLVRLARAYRQQEGTERTRLPGALTTRFQRCVETGFREERRVSRYARRLGVTRGHLNDVVRGDLGRPPGEILRARVLREARRLLLQTELSVTEVARRCGFDDPSYFGKYFRRYVGRPPGAYRALSRRNHR